MEEAITRSPREEDKKLRSKGKGKGMIGAGSGSKPFIIDPQTGMKIFISLIEPGKAIEIGKDPLINIEKRAKGGRAGYKSGMRVCKLAKRGKGKAYGKNS